jgi:tetratricopeptide (TPR) repeat protein
MAHKLNSGKSLRLLILPLLALAVVALTANVSAQTAEEYYNQGVQAMQNSNYDVAIPAFQGAIEANPDYVDAYLNLGVIYFEQNNYDEALDMFRQATEKDPKNADAFANLGRVQAKLRKYVEAEASLKKALELKGADPDLYKELAMVYYSKSSYGDVVDVIDKLHAAGGGDYLTWYMLGKSKQKLDKTNEAIQALEKSAELNPDYYNAHSALGQIYLGQEKYRQAANAFKAAEKSDPNKAYRAAYNFAVAMENLSPEDYAANIANWERYVKLAKNNPKASRDVAVAKEHIEKLKDAEKHAELQ